MLRAEEIRIYRKGKNKTIASTVYAGRLLKGKASCNLKEDKYDFKIGAQIAFKRLIEKMNTLTFRCRCVEDGWAGFTLGKIYEVKDGVMIGDDGLPYWYPYDSDSQFVKIEGARIQS